ncbi:MAG TPA: response regulator [Candidatus Nitrosopolaris rasttigaisensis]|jgi:DNA-binding response OmpR family regulator|nr:response regulator [Candidatus Nitrosopolaris rasttigaisensis]
MNNTSNSRRILLVDNEPDNTSVFSMGLEDAGFKVDAFNDSLLALSNFKARFYDLSILDINMPNMNGFELYKEIRKVDEKVRVCFLTASEIYHESLRVPPQTLKDVKCFIPKPIAIDDFIKRIEEELSR